MHDREKIIQERSRWIKRRKYIVEQVYGSTVDVWGGLGALSKGKVHCSCPMCSEKTRVHSLDFKTSRGLRKNWKHSDKIRLLKGSENNF